MIMKKISFTLFCIALAGSLSAQDFNANLQTARTSYSSGKLEASRFAMEQMLQELEIISGKEALKLFPSALGGLTTIATEDEVHGGAGFAGAVIRREYASGDMKASLEVISNSPLISSLNAMLALPFMGTGSNGERRVVKIDGYKALIQKVSDSDKPAYEVQIPIGSALVSLRTENYTGDIAKLATEIPVGEISKKLN